MQDGIYFDMPEEVYHALPRLSVSGMQKLLVSPATFWASSWLNPKKAGTFAASLAASASILAVAVLDALKAMHPAMPEPEPDEAEESTKAQLLGKAYHTARLEPELLEVRFVRQPDKRDMPKGSLFTGTEMGKALEELGEKKSGSVLEQAERLAAAGFDRAKLWHIVMADWEGTRNGRTPIPAEYWEDIQSDMELIRSTPGVAALLVNGQAEVSILWTDGNGIPMKCRLDYLREDGWTDFKTFANANGKHLEQCIADAFIYNRYHVQAAGYREAVEMVRTGKLSIQGDASDEQRELIDAIYLHDAPMECHYVFQEKGGIPNLIAKRMRFLEVPLNTQINSAGASDEARARVEAATATPSLWFVRANREIRKAKRLFHAYSEIYQPGEPWRPFNPVGEFTDMDFRTYWLDEEIAD